MEADEAIRCGLVSRVFENKDGMVAEALAMAKQIASKSPVAIAGTKHNLNYSRGRPIADTLEYMATWNAAMLQTEDIASAAVASLQKKDQPDFSKL
jgi:delta(3,5)-delta(2,4)-dienoyl-CoA isomerase